MLAGVFVCGMLGRYCICWRKPTLAILAVGVGIFWVLAVPVGSEVGVETEYVWGYAYLTPRVQTRRHSRHC